MKINVLPKTLLTFLYLYLFSVLKSELILLQKFCLHYDPGL